MEWSDKQKLVSLSHMMHVGAKEKEDFHSFCLEKMPDFDTDTWIIFLETIQLIPEKMKEDIKFWRYAWKYVKDIECSEINLRSMIRITLMQSICEDELKLPKKKT